MYTQRNTIKKILLLLQAKLYKGHLTLDVIVTQQGGSNTVLYIHNIIIKEILLILLLLLQVKDDEMKLYKGYLAY